MQYYEYVTPQNLEKFWQNIKEYYADDIETSTPIHVGDNTTVTTRSLKNPDGHIASTLYVKNFVADTLVSGGLTSIPVLDVTVNGTSVLNNQTAEVKIPILSISVEGSKIEPFAYNVNIPRLINDIRADGKSIIENKIVNIPLQHIKVNEAEIPINEYASNIIIKRNGQLLQYDDGINIIVPTQPSDIGAVSQTELSQVTSTIANVQQAVETNRSNISLNVKSISNLNTDFYLLNQSLTSVQEEVKSNAQDFADLVNSIGKPLGLAQLNAEGKVDLSSIPNMPVRSVSSYDLLPNPGESGVIYITLDNDAAWLWKEQDKKYEEIGGIDATLRVQVETHLQDISNPHKVTAEQIGLDKVNNTSDAEKPLSDATVEALANKVNVDDIVNNLETYLPTKVLGARQGIVLKDKIAQVEASISGLGNPFEFQGTVSTYNNLPQSANRGDVYQTEDTEETYAWNGTSWVTIAVAIVDITKYIATQDEIYGIIDSYVEDF